MAEGEIMNEKLNIKAAGHVKQILLADGSTLREGHNLIVNTHLEVLMQCLMLGSSAAISSIVFGNSGTTVVGVPPLLSPSMASVPTLSGGAISPINQFADTQSYTSDDTMGLASIGTFTTIYTATDVSGFTYDTLGLVSATGLLFSVYSFLPVTLPQNQSVAVQWTIMLNGQG
jgi:hypothetical protein